MIQTDKTSKDMGEGLKMNNNDMVFFLLNSYYSRHHMVWRLRHGRFKEIIRPMKRQLRVCNN